MTTKRNREDLLHLVFTIDGKDVEVEVTRETAEELYHQLREELLYS